MEQNSNNMPLAASGTQQQEDGTFKKIISVSLR